MRLLALRVETRAAIPVERQPQAVMAAPASVQICPRVLKWILVPHFPSSRSSLRVLVQRG